MTILEAIQREAKGQCGPGGQRDVCVEFVAMVGLNATTTLTRQQPCVILRMYQVRDILYEAIRIQERVHTYETRSARRPAVFGISS